MRGIKKTVQAVADHFEVPADMIRSESRKSPLPLCRKIIIHLLEGHVTGRICRAVNRNSSVVSSYRSYMYRAAESDPVIISHIRSVIEKLQDMNIKLTKNQLNSLFEVITDFLEIRQENVESQLIALHLDDIREKVRRRIRAGKENLGLDDKQLRAFLVFHVRCSPVYEHKHPHGYMTLLYMIQQIRPTNSQINLTD